MLFKRKLYFTQIEAIKMDGYIKSIVSYRLMDYNYLIILPELILYLNFDGNWKLPIVAAQRNIGVLPDLILSGNPEYIKLERGMLTDKITIWLRETQGWLRPKETETILNFFK